MAAIAKRAPKQLTKQPLQKQAVQKQPMKERILDTAERLFYRHGIRAIGVDTIAAEVGISKRTLYNHFPSKDALIAAYLKRGFYTPHASDRPPVEQILRTFDRLEKGFAAKDFRGCRFVNAVAELGEDDRAARKIALDFKEDRRLWFRERLLAIGAKDAEQLATQLALLVDGAIAMAMVRGDPSMARAAASAARVLLANAGIDVSDGSRKMVRAGLAGPAAGA
jgi:AcrR family transcriptional regulator